MSEKRPTYIEIIEERIEALEKKTVFSRRKNRKRSQRFTRICVLYKHGSFR